MNGIKMLVLFVCTLVGWAFCSVVVPRPEFLKEDESIMVNGHDGNAETGLSAMALEGKILFMRHCAQCHSPNLASDLTGPALAEVTSRAPSRKWVYQWIQNSSALVAAGDPYALALKAKWKTTMPAIPLSEAQIDTLLAFIERK